MPMRQHKPHTLIAPLLMAACFTLSVPGMAQPPVQDAAPAPAGSLVDALLVQRQDIATSLYEVVYSKRQDAVFVASAGGLTPDAKDSPPSRILRLMPDTLAVQTEIALPARGFGLALDDAADRLYVTHGLDAALSVIDTRSNRVMATLQLAAKLENIDASDPFAQKYPHSFRTMTLDATNQRLYIPGLWMQDSALYVVDTRDLRLHAVVPGLGYMSMGSALSPDRKHLYVSNLAGQLFTIDTETLNIIRVSSTDAEQALSVHADTQGERLFIVDQGLEVLNAMRKKHDAGFSGPHSPGNRIVVLDVQSQQTLATLSTGAGPVALLLDAARERLYATNRGSGTVTVFDSANYQKLQTLQLPPYPNSLALDTQNNVLYVTVKHEESNGASPPTRPESVVRVKF